MEAGITGTSSGRSLHELRQEASRKYKLNKALIDKGIQIPDTKEVPPECLCTLFGRDCPKFVALGSRQKRTIVCSAGAGIQDRHFGDVTYGEARACLRHRLISIAILTAMTIKATVDSIGTLARVSLQR